MIDLNIVKKNISNVASWNRENGEISNSGNNKFVLVSMFLILIILIILPNVLSLGITPGRTTINYEPGLEKEV